MKKIILVFFCGVLSACQSMPTSSEWLARGEGYAQDGKSAQAIKAYNHALQLNPQRADIYAARGTAYFNQGEYALAAQDFAETLNRNPYYTDAYTALASALAAQGAYEEAMEVINQVLVLAPSKPEIFFTRGGINFMLEKYDQAVQDYSMVLRARPAVDVLEARAAAYSKLGQTEKAKQDLQEAKSGQYLSNLSDYQKIR
ncbi:MAG: tetratricopeptide repeat protein [Elusimicrobiaceae bacterium]|nr:tetratricopeptide repeat protein [Elusimicrobiaceae bacterium]